MPVIVTRPLDVALAITAVHRERQRAARSEVALDVRRRPTLADRPADALQLTDQVEHVTGLDEALEAHIVDARKEREPATVLIFREDGDGARLRHRLDDQDARHDRPAGKVALEVPLVGANALARDDARARLELEHLVDEEKRITMRQDRLDLCPPERGFKASCHERPSVDKRMETLAPDMVVPRLRGRFGHPYLYAETTSSTQRMLGPEHGEGAVAVAEEQVEGRGRLGRTWSSPRGVSILCSLLLEPQVETPRLPELSIVAGEACAEAILRVTGLTPRIKLPNDVLIDGRKVAGILAEAHNHRVVLGIGINVNVDPADLPDGLRTPATSLAAELGRPVDRAELLVALLEALEKHYRRWLPS